MSAALAAAYDDARGAACVRGARGKRIDAAKDA
jgi:hypothetical protein